MSTINRFVRKAMPHMIWLGAEQKRSIPGTSIEFMRGFDLRVEQYAPERYGEIMTAITKDGVVGPTTSGSWVFFKLPATEDPIMRFASAFEVDELVHLPDEWESNVNVDGFGAMPEERVG